MNNSREIWLDYAKGLGILLVVLGHTNRGLFNAGIGIDPTIFRVSDSVIYSFHMPLFFYLSGCFFNASYQRHSGWGLLRDKTATLVYPYLVWSIMQGCIEVALSQITNLNASWRDIASILWQPRAQFWFLYILFLLFIVFTIPRIYLKQWRTPWIVAITFVLYVSQMFWDFVFPLNFIAAYAFFFFLGSEKHLLEKIPNTLFSIIVISILFLGAEYVWHIPLNRLYNDKSIALLLVTCLGVLWALMLSRFLATRFPNSFTWLARLGVYSMPLFLAHILAASGTRIILAKVFHVQNVQVHWWLGMAAGIFFPILLYLLAQKNRYLNLLFQSPWR